MIANQKYRINALAKDFGMKSADIVNLLKEKGIDGKTYMSVLEPAEFEIIFEQLTVANQVTNMNEYLAAKADVAEADRKKPAKKKEEKKENAEEKKSETKPEPEKAEKKDEKKDEKKEQKPAKSDKSEKTEKQAKPAEQKKPEEPKAKKADVQKDKKTEAQKEKPAEREKKPVAEKPVAEPKKAEPAVEHKANVKTDVMTEKVQIVQVRDGKRPLKLPEKVLKTQQGAQNNGQNRQQRPATAQNQQGQNRSGQQNQQRNDRGAQQNPQQRNQRQNLSGEQLRQAEAARKQDRDRQMKEKFAQKPAEPRQKPQKQAPVKQADRPSSVIASSGKISTDYSLGSGTRIVDTRTVTVDLGKYDEKLESFVKDNGSNYKGEKQKIKKKNQNDKSTKNKSERDKERAAMEKMRREALEKAKKQPLHITVPDEITVSELASRLKLNVGEVIKKLMGLGVMATVNDVVEYDTAFLVADEFGAIVTKEVVVTIEEKLFDTEEDKAEDLVERSPVVCVMGHVDHGKTSLLDAIRHTSVTKGEAGGITQHIGAYRVSINGKDITFLDTPGHAAFTAMRARGAKSTDVAIIVVAADDGIMPQTIEAINHAKAAGVDIIVAINKMDKPTANPDMIKNELTKYELVPEEWGGDTICVPVSALTGKGIDELLENVLLVAEMRELKANPNRAAKGVVIESRLDKGRGPVATVLVQNGTLNAGDIVIAGTAVGHVRAMTDDKGKRVKTAGPSVPVEITGLSEVPLAGDEFNAVADEKMARELADQRRAKEKENEFKASARASLDDMFSQISSGIKTFNIIVKADVAGSAEAVCSSLEKLSNDEVRIKIIHKAAGGITEGDVMLAAASEAIIIGFNVRPDKTALDSAERSSVEIRTYRVIYDCIEEITAAMKGMLAPEYKEVLLGHAEVRQTIRVPNVGTIAGSYITDGKITRASLIRVLRDSNIIFEDKISSLRRFKDDVKDVASGYECGIGLEKFNDICVGDVLEAYIMEEIKR